MNQPLWTKHLLDESAVRDWISAVLPGHPNVTGPITVYNAKDWGVTARFAIDITDGQDYCSDSRLPVSDQVMYQPNEVVFKACLLPLFSDAPLTYELLSRYCAINVPELLAWEKQQGGTWVLFCPFQGETVKSVENLQPLLELARTMARIQVAIAELPSSETKCLPRTPVECVPAFLDEIIQDIRNKYVTIWSEKGTIAKQYNNPLDLLSRLVFFQPKLAEWTAELKSIGHPNSIDHVDLHSENAVVQTDGNLIIYDWEEAIISHPFFSLDRLLEDALEFGEVGQIAVRQAYLNEIPWGTLRERERAFDLAMCLSPIKFAYETKVFDEALGRERGNPKLTAWCVTRALQRWESMPT